LTLNMQIFKNNTCFSEKQFKIIISSLL